MAGDYIFTAPYLIHKHSLYMCRKWALSLRRTYLPRSRNQQCDKKKKLSVIFISAISSIIDLQAAQHMSSQTLSDYPKEHDSEKKGKAL